MRGSPAIALALVVEAFASTSVAGLHRHLWSRESDDQRRYRQVAAYVAERTGPDEPLLVWGNSPEIHFYASRPLATRYLSSNYHTGHVWGTPTNEDGAAGDPRATSGRAWDLLLADLARTRPALVVDAAAGGLDHMEADPIERPAEQNAPEGGEGPAARGGPRALRAWLRAHYRWQANVAGVPIYARSGRPGMVDVPERVSTTAPSLPPDVLPASGDQTLDNQP